MPSIQEIESQLTPQEMAIVNYHRNTIKTNTVGKDELGRPVTVFSNTIQIPEGQYRGQFVTVPGYFGGKLTSDEHALWKQWAPQVNQGVWPMYKDPKHADQRAKFIHGIMDQEEIPQFSGRK
jgi:hypothetical protein